MENKLEHKNSNMPWNDEQIAVIKRLIAPNLTNDELLLFAHICKRTHLDPFAKQIYAIKRGGRMCIQTGIDGFRVIAERTGKYAPGQDTEFLYDDNKRLVGAKVYVKKMTPDGTWHNISATAFLSEYNANQGLWKTMPSVMIEKCAEARALRRAFPADLSGLYSDEEMDQADTSKRDIKDDVEVVDEKNLPIDEATIKEVNKYLEGKDDIRKGLLQICEVKKVEDIKNFQRDACRKFIKAALEKKEKANEVQYKNQ